MLQMILKCHHFCKEKSSGSEIFGTVFTGRIDSRAHIPMCSDVGWEVGREERRSLFSVNESLFV